MSKLKVQMPNFVKEKVLTFSHFAHSIGIWILTFELVPYLGLYFGFRHSNFGFNGVG